MSHFTQQPSLIQWQKSAQNETKITGENVTITPVDDEEKVVKFKATKPAREKPRQRSRDDKKYKESPRSRSPRKMKEE